VASFLAWRLRRGLRATSVVAFGVVAATTTPLRAAEQWTGAASTDWFSVGNWSAGVPTSSTSTIIDTVTPNATVVGAAGARATGLRVGGAGTGALTIQNGGTVNNTLGIIGDAAGSSGTATVDGAGSAWTNSSDFYVGHAGSGTLTIRNGGALSNVYGFVGNFSGATGAVTVDGAGSSWSNSGDLQIGAYGSGTLTIRNGGTVSNGYSFVGQYSGATGVVTVDGAGSTWSNGGDLNVGYSGSGTLIISSGGAVSSVYGWLGNDAGTTGAVTVDGAGSSWTNSVDLTLGASGTGSGTLTIRNGGAVRNGGSGVLGNDVGATGTATVDGAGSSWTNSGDLFVGAIGSGTLSIRNGGAVRNGYGLVGFQTGATGAVTVDGAGSTWTNSGRLTVGAFGAGTLTIRNGGVVSASSMSIAKQAGSTGTLNIGAAVGQTAGAPGTLRAASVDFGNGTGEIVFNHTAANYIFAPVITRSGAGTATVRVEAGTTILTATSSYTGATVIDGGTLSVDGSIARSAVTVNAGGVLGGNGTVGTTTINGGALAPGNSIGLLTVNGNLSFTAASSYMVEISPAQADRVNVTGMATLSGATVNASFAFAAGSRVASQYTIVNAGGGISGRFGSVVNSNLPSGFKPSLSYDGNNAYLDLALVFAVPANTQLSANQSAVGNALINSFNRNGGIALVYGGLTAPGLTQASGEIATAVQPAMAQAMTQFMTMVTDLTASGRFPGAPGAIGFTEDDTANADVAFGNRGGSAHEAFGMIMKAPRRAPTFEQRWRVWAAGFGGGQTTDGNAATGSSTSTSRLYGVAAGVDYWLSQAAVAGFALAGGGTQFSVAAGGSGRSELFQAASFIKYTAGSAYVSAAAAFGWHDVTTDRAVTISGIDQLRARFAADIFSGRLEGGDRLVTPWFGGLGLTPYAAAQVTTTHLPNYTETVVSGANSFALSYLAKNLTAPRTELGWRSDKSIAVNDALLTLRGRAAWAHDFNTDVAASATFQALPGASFVVKGAAAAHDAALTTASAEMQWRNGVTLAATFEGEFSAVARSYAGKAVMAYAW
jgi:T5SS/PEP-CTERM-associated repeat protein/autotransporter-associated beta strand protein